MYIRFFDVGIMVLFLSICSEVQSSIISSIFKFYFLCLIFSKNQNSNSLVKLA